MKGIERFFEDDMTNDKHKSESGEVRSPMVGNLDLQFIGGYLYIVARGHGFLITASTNTLLCPIHLVTEHKLETGEYVEVKADNHACIEILKRGKKPSKFTATRPFKTVNCDGLEFKLGNRVLCNCSPSFDFIEYMNTVSKQMAKLHKVALIFDESDDCIEYLAKSGFEVYLTKVNHHTKKKIMFALTALFRAKDLAHDGIDVIFFIDNLNKMFRVYNSTDTEKDTIATTINAGAYTDLKCFYMEAKQICNGGSLTIVTNIHKGSTDNEKYLFDDFSSLCNVLVDLT
jgi:hypothetical protein